MREHNSGREPDNTIAYLKLPPPRNPTAQPSSLPEPRHRAQLICIGVLVTTLCGILVYTGFGVIVGSVLTACALYKINQTIDEFMQGEKS